MRKIKDYTNFGGKSEFGGGGLITRYKHRWKYNII